MMAIAESTSVRAKVEATSLADLRGDLNDLAAQADAAVARLVQCRKACEARRELYRAATLSQLAIRTEALIRDFAEIASALYARLDASATWMACDQAQLQEAKRDAADLLRTLFGQLGSVLCAAEWQSPSRQHSQVAQSGQRGSGFIARSGDYTRDGHKDAQAYEMAFIKEYVDSRWHVPVQAFLTSSGMSAIATVVALLRAREGTGPIAVGASTYFETRWLLQRTFGEAIYEFDESDAEGLLEAVRRIRPRAVFLDSLCNAPNLAVPNLSQVLPALNEVLPRGAAIVIDNTAMGMACQPLTLLPTHGNRVQLFVIESLNKYHQFGFDRVTGGVVWTVGQSQRAALDRYRKHLGTIMPDTNALSLPAPSRTRMMRRLARIDRNALFLAEQLACELSSRGSPYFSQVVHPGLSSHRSYLWTRDAVFRGASVVLVPRYSLGGKLFARYFIRRAIGAARRAGVAMVAGTSFGFDVTRLYLTAQSSGDIVRPFLRISAGTESLSEAHAIARVLTATLGSL